MPRKTLEASLVVRMDEKKLRTFKAKTLKTTGKPYQLFVREIVDAFNEDRLRIKPTTDQNVGELYNVN